MPSAVWHKTVCETFKIIGKMENGGNVIPQRCFSSNSILKTKENQTKTKPGLKQDDLHELFLPLQPAICYLY